MGLVGVSLLLVARYNRFLGEGAERSASATQEPNFVQRYGMALGRQVPVLVRLGRIGVIVGIPILVIGFALGSAR